MERWLLRMCHEPWIHKFNSRVNEANICTPFMDALPRHWLSMITQQLSFPKYLTFTEFFFDDKQYLKLFVI